MADIDFGQLSEALNDKSDRDLRNVDTTAKADAVIDYQEPTAENGYTWYRKYKSGWVEQGGRVTSGGGGIIVNLPVTMADVYYTITYAQGGMDNDYDSGTDTIKTDTLTTTSFQLNRYVSGATSYWEVKGMAAN